jgi:hypothetical protein
MAYSVNCFVFRTRIHARTWINLVTLRTGMVLTAFDEDADEHGNRDDLIASGIVEPSPPWLRCNGSRWTLRIDQHGVRHESDLQGST